MVSMRGGGVQDDVNEDGVHERGKGFDRRHERALAAMRRVFDAGEREVDGIVVAGLEEIEFDIFSEDELGSLETRLRLVAADLLLSEATRRWQEATGRQREVPASQEEVAACEGKEEEEGRLLACAGEEAPACSPSAEDPYDLVHIEALIAEHSRGSYDPLAMRCRRRVASQDVHRVTDVYKGRVSVVVPTMEARQKFHKQLWHVFDAQSTWLDKELIIVETFTKSPSQFFAAKSREDPRVIHVAIQVDIGADLSIGCKRNICTHVASGEYIAHFDDDDVYAPEYLSSMIDTMCHETADAVTLSGWYILDVSTGIVGHLDPEDVCDEQDLSTRDGWVFGYGFSYVYTRDVALLFPYADINMGEDWEFFRAIRQRNANRQAGRETKLGLMEPAGVALLRDRWGLCLHLLHQTGTSNCWADRRVPANEVQALAVKGLGDIFQAQFQSSPDQATASKFIVGPPREMWRPLHICSEHNQYLELTISAGATAMDVRQKVQKEWGSRFNLFSQQSPLDDGEIIPLMCEWLWAAKAPRVVKVIDMLDLTLSVSLELPDGHVTNKMVKDALLKMFKRDGAVSNTRVAEVKLARLTKSHTFMGLTPGADLGRRQVVFATGLAELLGKERVIEEEDVRNRQLASLLTSSSEG